MAQRKKFLVVGTFLDKLEKKNSAGFLNIYVVNTYISSVPSLFTDDLLKVRHVSSS